LIYFFLYPLFIIEPADFILDALEAGLAFSIFIILPLGMVFLVGITFSCCEAYAPWFLAW